MTENSDVEMEIREIRSALSCRLSRSNFFYNFADFEEVWYTVWAAGTKAPVAPCRQAVYEAQVLGPSNDR